MATNGLENEKHVAYFEYDYDLDGGAVGDIELRGASLPDDALVVDGMLRVNKQVTSGGSATLALKLKTSEDVLAAAAVAGFTADAIMDVVPDDSHTHAVLITTNGTGLTLTVAAAALTAGKFTVGVDYYLMG